MTDEIEVEITEVGGGVTHVGRKGEKATLAVVPFGERGGFQVYKIGEENQAGRALGNGGVDYARRLIAGGKLDRRPTR